MTVDNKNYTRLLSDALLTSLHHHDLYHEPFTFEYVKIANNCVCDQDIITNCCRGHAWE